MTKLDQVVLEGVLVCKPVYALCSLNTKTRKLKAVKYCMVVTGGRDPVWGVWSMRGAFARYFSKRSTVEEAHEKLVWRRMSGRLTMSVPVIDQPAEAERRSVLGYYDQAKRGRRTGNVVRLRE